MKYKSLVSIYLFVNITIIQAEPRTPLISLPSVSNISTKVPVTHKIGKTDIPNLPPALAGANPPLSVIENDTSNKPMPLKKKIVKRKPKISNNFTGNTSNTKSESLGGLKVIENGQIKIEKINSISAKDNINASNIIVDVNSKNINNQNPDLSNIKDLKHEILLLKEQINDLKNK